MRTFLTALCLALLAGPSLAQIGSINLLDNDRKKTQEEIDRLWAKLVADGETRDCGWLKDRYGLFWQINYAGLQDMMADSHPERADRVMAALLKMKKIDIQTLKDAYEGE